MKMMLKAAAAAALLALGHAEKVEVESDGWCKTIESEGDDKKCWDHIQWAITEGRDAHPEWYPDGSTGSVVDMQCALFLKAGGDITGNSHNCTKPSCLPISSSMAKGSDDEVVKCLPPMKESEDKGPSIEWWGWLLITAAVVGIGALAAYAMGVFGPKKPKKKRAIKALEPEPAPVATTVSAVPVYEVAPPVYTYTAQPTYQATQSIAVAAPSVVTAAPVYTTGGSVVVPAAAPVSVAQPVYTTSTITASNVVIDG